jgi:hypothetical protein
MKKREHFMAEIWQGGGLALALPHSRHYLAKRGTHPGLARAATATRYDPKSKGNLSMRKIALFAAVAGAALSLAACSEKTEDAAATAVDSAAADTEANAEAAGAAVTDAASDVDAAAENAAATAEGEAAEVEADAQDETVGEAKAD